MDEGEMQMTKCRCGCGGADRIYRKSCQMRTLAPVLAGTGPGYAETMVPRLGRRSASLVHSTALLLGIPEEHGKCRTACSLLSLSVKKIPTDLRIQPPISDVILSVLLVTVIQVDIVLAIGDPEEQFSFIYSF